MNILVKNGRMIKFLGGSGILAKVLRYLIPTVLFNALYGITPDSMYRLPSMRFSADLSNLKEIYYGFCAHG